MPQELSCWYLAAWRWPAADCWSSRCSRHFWARLAQSAPLLTAGPLLEAPLSPRFQWPPLPIIGSSVNLRLVTNLAATFKRRYLVLWWWAARIVGSKGGRWFSPHCSAQIEVLPKSALCCQEVAFRVFGRRFCWPPPKLLICFASI